MAILKLNEIFKSFIKLNSEPNEVPFEVPKLNANIAARFSLGGKVSAVTGGLGGIGRCICEGFAQSGSDLAILDYSTDGNQFGESLGAKYGVKCKTYKMDVRDPKKVEEVVQAIVDDFGTIDVFVANAGVPWFKGAIIDETYDLTDWHDLFDINVNGVFYCAKYVGKVFKKNNRGSFIITASMSANIVNVPEYKAAYNASKAAVFHFSRSVAVEWAAFARCNTVSPGYTNTPISDPVDVKDRARWWALTPMGREAEPDELVGAYIYLASDASSFTTGADIRVDGGYSIV